MPEIKFRDTYSRDNIKSMLKNGVKAAYLLDGSSRIEVLYEAPLHASIGDPCLATSFKYADGAGGSSRVVIASMEEVVAWPGFEVVQVGAGNDFDALL